MSIAKYEHYLKMLEKDIKEKDIFIFPQQLKL